MPSHFPHFIEDKLIHSFNLNISRNQRSSVALLRNLHLYEVNKNQIINYIDLQNTILSKIQYKFDSIELEENGTTSQGGDNFGNSKSCANHDIGGIMFGKYIFQYRKEKIVFILIKCWNYMVVIQRDLEGFSLQAEYEDVRSFSMIKGRNYEVQVSILFLHNDHLEVTNFQKRQPSSEAMLPTTDVYKKMLDKIKVQSSELLVHQTITRKEFAKLKSRELFGSNILRTPRPEELQILSKCGNAWIRLTADDDVVLGVPVVNNCSSRLTILHNFKAVLQGVGDLSHTFKFYQLNKSFCDITETIESIFSDSESVDKYSTKCSWRRCLDLSLRPEAFGVLIIHLKISDIFSKSGFVFPLFVFYDVYKSNTRFSQKCFITSISLQDIFTNESYRLNFDQKHLNCDLLTVIASSYETELRLEYVVTGAALEEYLSRKLGFHKVPLRGSFSEAMNIDGEDDDINDTTIKQKLIFYNQNKDSFWHGTLLEIAHLNDSTSDVRIFTKSQQKSTVFLNLLRMDLKAICGIKEVTKDIRRIMPNKLIEFEAALREECSSCLDTYSNSAMSKTRTDIDKKKILHNHIHLNKLKTDLLFKDLQL